MTLSVSIYDFDSQSTVNVTDRVKSVSVSESLDGSATADLSLKNLTETHAWDAVEITYDGNPLFSGTIMSQSDDLLGRDHRASTWQAKDASMRLERRVVNKRYENMGVEDIIADMLASYPCGVTGNNVGITNVVIEEIAFPFVNLYECIKQLAEITGWRWYVDYNYDLHFFQSDEGESGMVFSTTSDGGLTQNIRAETISLDTEIDDKTANRVWIIGARQASLAYKEQYFTGDGRNNTFGVPFEPNYPEVFENGVSKTIELDRGTASDKDYVYDKVNRVFTRVSGPLPTGVELLVRYRPTTQIIDYFEDSASTAIYGIHEKAIKDKTIKERMAARSRGRTELRRRASAFRRISFDTREMDVRRGLRYRIVIPELGIDSSWLCTETSTTISAPDHTNYGKSVTLEEVS